MPEQINIESYIQMTAANFTAILEGGYQEYLKNHPNEINKKIISFKKITITEPILISGVELDYEIWFTDCNIRNILFSKSHLRTLVFKNSVIDKVDFLSGSSIDRINVEDNSKIECFFCKKLYVKERFEIKSSSINQLQIWSASWIENLEITGDTKIKDIWLWGSTIYYFDSKYNDFNDINIEESELGMLRFEGSSIKGSLTIKEKSKICYLYLQNRELRQVSIYENCFIETLDWKQNTICTFNCSDSEIINILFDNTLIPKDSVFQFANISVNHFLFKNTINTAWFSLNHIKPLSIYDEYEKDTKKFPITLENKKEDSIFSKFSKQIDLPPKYFKKIKRFALYTTFSIQSSDLGKMSFISCSFNEFDIFELYNSKMLEIFVAGITFGNITIPVENIEEEVEQKRLTYGQFKKIYENRGDTVTALEYYTKEMAEYIIQLENKIKGNGLSKIEKNSIKANLCNLRINAFSSNHGTDWWLALRNTTILTIVCYTIYCWLNGYLLGCDVKLFMKLVSNIFDFLNPLPKTEATLQNPDIYQSIAKLWAGFSRIFIAYFVYQTIQAFRKFGKKAI